MNKSGLVWVEKYRPSNVEDCILPDRIKETFKEFVKQGSFPNLLLSGSPGTGKTTLAKALLEEMDFDYLFINASKERKIETIRLTVTDFASSASLEGKKKAIILDEADGLTSEAQDSLRGVVEAFPKVNFIFTCNLRNKVLPALQSRTTLVEFTIKPNEKKLVMAQFLKRVTEILKLENIKYEVPSVVEILKKHYPDNRRILNELQFYSSGGTIDPEFLNSNLNTLKELIEAIRTKDFKAMRLWVANNADMSPGNLYRDLYNALYDEVQPECVPQLVMTIGEYDYRSAFVSNQEINTTALLANIMGSVQFK